MLCRLYYLLCDAQPCTLGITEPTDTRAMAWAEGKALGWTRDGKRHLCPEHSGAAQATPDPPRPARWGPVT